MFVLALPSSDQMGVQSGVSCRLYARKPTWVAWCIRREQPVGVPSSSHAVCCAAGAARWVSSTERMRGSLASIENVFLVRVILYPYSSRLSWVE